MPNLTMRALKVSKWSLHRLLSMVVGAGTVLWLAQPTLAQVTNAQPLQEFKPQEANRDPFSSNGSGQASGVLDLIHRANFGNIRSISDFNTDQEQNLSDAAAKFRAQQLERLRSQPQPQNPAATPVTAPASN